MIRVKSRHPSSSLLFEINLIIRDVRLENEIWKPVVGYEGLYEVSNYGRIRSIDRTVFQQGRIQRYSGCIMSPFVNNHGYYSIRLSKNNRKSTFSVHRLVAIAFIPNPHNYPVINHKDETHTNNCVSNLEWCTQKYNVNYGTVRERVSESNGMKVAQYDLDGNLIGFYKSIKDASRKTGVCTTSINGCVLGKYYTGGKFIWLATEKPSEKIIPKFSKRYRGKISQYDMDMNLIAKYNSGREAAIKTGFSHENICSCCRGILKSYKGYKWRYNGEKAEYNSLHKNQRAIEQLSLDGSVIKRFESIAAAAKSFQLKDSACIKNCLCGNSKTSLGYKWRYVNG